MVGKLSRGSRGHSVFVTIDYVDAISNIMSPDSKPNLGNISENMQIQNSIFDVKLQHVGL